MFYYEALYTVERLTFINRFYILFFNSSTLINGALTFECFVLQKNNNNRFKKSKFDFIFK